MPTAPPELAYESVAGLVGRTLTVAGQASDGAFIVPLTLVGVSAPSTYQRLTAFTAELVGPVGTRLTAPGNYLTLDGGQRFSLTLSWVNQHPQAVHYRATFVHRATREAGSLGASQHVSHRSHRRGDHSVGTITRVEQDWEVFTGPTEFHDYRCATPPREFRHRALRVTS